MDLVLRKCSVQLRPPFQPTRAGQPVTYSERQYKKITEWNLDKNVKDHEMQAILKILEERKRLEGKDSVFYVRGHLVEPKKIERYVQRKCGNREGPFDPRVPDHGRLLPDDLAGSMTTKDIRCCTPPKDSEIALGGMFESLGPQNTSNTQLIDGTASPRQREP